MNLTELLERRSIEDIVLSPRGLAFYEHGAWSPPRASVDTTPAALLTLSRHIAEQACVTLGLTQPSVDAYLPIGHETFRAHVVVPPLVMSGPEITLRRLPELHRFSLEDFEAEPIHIAQIKDAVVSGKSLLIAGATGSGKTSFMTALLNLIPQTQRVLILEDSPELPLPNDLSTKLIARSDRFGFRSGATWGLSHLVFESLRMRPDRLVLGECRGPEASAIETALMTGHAGVMTTLHAGSAAQALERFANLAGHVTSEAIQASSLLWGGIVHIKGDAQGGRKITEFLTSPKINGD